MIVEQKVLALQAALGELGQYDNADAVLRRIAADGVTGGQLRSSRGCAVALWVRQRPGLDGAAVGVYTANANEFAKSVYMPDVVTDAVILFDSGAGPEELYG